MSLIADIVVSSAAAAFAHFGMSVDLPEREPGEAQRAVARTPAPRPQPAKASAEDCPERKLLLHRT